MRQRIVPKKSLGQNFLKDERTAYSIVHAMNLTSHDHVLEIGPGRGTMTHLILPLVGQMIAVEIDPRCVELLRARYSDRTNFTLVQDDFLNINLDDFKKGDSNRIFGNIPYHLTSPIIFKVFDQREKIYDLTLLIQREVADRIVAHPSSKAYGILSVMSQLYADVRILLKVPRTVFSPRPKVESALVQWLFTPQRAEKVKDVEFFRMIVRQAFGQRRKMLRNSLKEYYFEDNPISIDFSQRPEQLSVLEWIQLANEILSIIAGKEKEIVV
jgi:16S rRNA (adenine1518-N6/adenine1519-N6)-dimethyltransferase